MKVASTMTNFAVFLTLVGSSLVGFAQTVQSPTSAPSKQKPGPAAQPSALDPKDEHEKAVQDHKVMIAEHEQWKKDHTEAEQILKLVVREIRDHHREIKQHEKIRAAHEKEIAKHEKSGKENDHANASAEHEKYMKIHSEHKAHHEEVMAALRALKSVLEKK